MPSGCCSGDSVTGVKDVNSCFVTTAKQLDRRRVSTQETLFRREYHDGISRGIVERPEFHLAVAQCFLGLSLIGDVPEKAWTPIVWPPGIAHGGLHDLHVSGFPVFFVFFDGFEQFTGLGHMQVIDVGTSAASSGG